MQITSTVGIHRVSIQSGAEMNVAHMPLARFAVKMPQAKSQWSLLGVGILAVWHLLGFRDWSLITEIGS